MRRLSVIEIWGVATRLTKRLNVLGIHPILDLSRADPVMIRDRFSVVMMRTVLELQGTPASRWRKNGSAATNSSSRAPSQPPSPPPPACGRS